MQLVCTSCKKLKKKECFSKMAKKPGAYHTRCKACKSRDASKYRKKNPEKVKAAKERCYRAKVSFYKDMHKRYYLDNKLKCLKRNSSWRLKNPGLMKEYKKKWKRLNKSKLLADCVKRRLSKLRATPGWLTKEDFKEIEKIYIAAKELEHLAGCKLHVDHIIPIKGKNVCGLHVPWNLQLLTAEENIAKGNKLNV